MTALTATESINRFKVLTTSKSASDTSGEGAGIPAGENFRSQDLLYPLLLTSSNDVAELYQEQVWHFVSVMNQKAEAIGLAHTIFTDASGRDSGNTSTAEDIFRLLSYIATHKKPIFDILGEREHQLNSADGKLFSWENLNWPEDRQFVAGKAGKTTSAKETMAGVYKVRLAEDVERPVAIIVLGADNRVTDIRAIIQYLENNFVYGNVLVQDHGPVTPVVREGASIYQALEP
ncbi:MAG: hypothetical protein A3H71_03710 [Candidatus Sungbacteria bacterium RIFCSPLOWO2_02_FULL_48_13b]|uniref:Peptidase S11 D-alanyl-D-alanine carboxypeptidase A N-terminal domain-containing protein n=1 Tax=Candidatus Sungbacteria bacterium RIFCSPLOWO2_02_FULL_48_13b TaxID=1802283 RepID=A0A1G2LFT9_9BACT|nr:MAG: hypothetical protein A3H71_03710 [Candidatus Sungbacteria bacterium RIFCSPLOWO2_02_FULL_48_13b]